MHPRRERLPLQCRRQPWRAPAGSLALLSRPPRSCTVVTGGLLLRQSLVQPLLSFPRRRGSGGSQLGHLSQKQALEYCCIVESYIYECSLMSIRIFRDASLDFRQTALPCHPPLKIKRMMEKRVFLGLCEQGKRLVYICVVIWETFP